jgi:hypothetical protein
MTTTQRIARLPVDTAQGIGGLERSRFARYLLGAASRHRAHRSASSASKARRSQHRIIAVNPRRERGRT